MLAAAELAEAELALAEALADALADEAAELEPLPPHAASPRQQAQSMAAHIIAIIFLIGSLSLDCLPCGIGYHELI